MYEKVYHPETDEMFEVPQHKAVELRLKHGWRVHPIDSTVEAAVKSVDDWRIEHQNIFEIEDETGDDN